MQPFGEELVRALQGGNWAIVAVIAIGMLLFRIRRLTEDFDWHRSRRIRTLQTSLRCRTLDESTRKMFEEELQTLLVIRAYGQSIDTPVRAAIVRLNQISPTRLPLRQLVAASKFLSVTDQGVVSISIPTIEKVEHWFNVAVAMVSLVLILICSIALVLIMPSVADHAGAVRAVKLIGLIAVFTSSLAYVAAQSRPHVAARRIAADVASASKMITSAPAGVSASVLSEKVRTGKSAHRA